MRFCGITTAFSLAFVVVIITCLKETVLGQVGAKFDDNYVVTFGNDHLVQLNHGREIKISLDQSSGAGFKSRLSYGSGYFQMKLKLPSKHSPGVVTTFYLTSTSNSKENHDELDFEFLGTDGPKYTLQTNVFANDNGGREQRLHLWFDPTEAFHNYAILWNSHQIVFFIDDIPIRVHGNYVANGARYPSLGMVVEASIWNGEAWASGGRKVDWSQAPFEANYQGFDITGCPFGNGCDSKALTWNAADKWKLNPQQHAAYENVKSKYVFYSYCSSPRGRLLYKECRFE